MTVFKSYFFFLLLQLTGKNVFCIWIQMSIFIVVPGIEDPALCIFLYVKEFQFIHTYS